MRKLSDWPIWLRLTGAVWLCLVVAWSGVIAWQTQVSRDIAIDQAKDIAHSMNEMTMAGLTGMMITGTVAQRNVFLDQIKELSAVRDLRVIRGAAVVKQFGPGAGSEAQPRDELERAALADGKPRIEIATSPELGQHLRVVYPALAAPNYLGKNCMSCHQVAAKTPLGAVSMKISLEKTNDAVSLFRNKSILFALIVSLPLMLVVFLFVRRVVTRPLQAMSESLTLLAKGEGDLTFRLDASHRDEIGTTAASFNRMLATIADLVRHVGESAKAVTDAAHQLTHGSARLADGSRQQNAQSEAAAQQVDALAGHIGDIASNAQAVHERSGESLTHSEQGRQSLVRLQSDVNQVEKAVQLMAQEESELVSATASITDMTRQVRDIADQTNLLALNAAIEAARAGEAGRGFAVVADEVRKLAEKSGQSANEIDVVTAALNKKTDAVRSAVSASLEHLASSHQSAQNVASVLDAATTSVAAVRNGLDQIVNVTEQQRQSSASMAQNIEAIAAMAHDNDVAIQQTVSAAEELQRLADALRDSVSRFKV